MKRILLLLAAALAVFLVGRAIVRTFASDETKIRWVIDDMARGFDDTRMDPILRGLSPEFRDESSGADRQDLRQGLAYLFFTAKAETEKRFRYRVDLVITKIEISRGDPDRPTAKCELSARFHESLAEGESVAWVVGVTATLERVDGGWFIHHTRHETRSGRMLRGG